MSFELKINAQQGNYIVADELNFFEFQKDSLKFSEIEIKPDTLTDFFGFYTEPLLFLGIMPWHSHKLAIFLLGVTPAQLFTPATFYFDAIFLLENEKIAKKFSEKTARDFYLKKEKDTFFWK